MIWPTSQKLRHGRAPTLANGTKSRTQHCRRTLLQALGVESIRVSWHRLARTFVIYLMEMHF